MVCERICRSVLITVELLLVLTAHTPSLRGPELAACVVRCGPGGRPARRPHEQPALACGGG
jgi:hypothetical protein